MVVIQSRLTSDHQPVVVVLGDCIPDWDAMGVENSKYYVNTKHKVCIDFRCDLSIKNCDSRKVKPAGSEPLKARNCEDRKVKGVNRNPDRMKP